MTTTISLNAKRFLFASMIAMCLIDFKVSAQAPPLPAPAASFDWRAGSNLTGIAFPNLFGTAFSNNNPIYFVTNGGFREKLNGEFFSTNQYSINGWAWPNVNTTGYLLLGQNVPLAGGPMTQNIYNTKGAFAALHINGGNNPLIGLQEFGYRPWMKWGTMVTSNQDMMYVGHRSLSASAQTDAVIQWANDAATGPFGPDNMVFLYTQGNGTNPSTNTDDLAGNDFDGREIMRLTGTGMVGIGPRFDNANLPTSTLHQHQENSASSWIQISNQRMSAGATNTGPTVTAPNDGFRIGIVGNATLNQNGNACIYNQELRHLLFGTNASTNSVNIPSGVTLERMRITAINAPTNLTGGGYGTYTPSGSTTPANRTRVSISHNPAQPVTRPMSLFHMGYNVGITQDGWRPWMELGTFISNGTDNTFLGLMNLGAVEQNDAVLNWGDNDGAVPDNFRFIFTSSIAGTNVPANGATGLEGMRMSPTATNGVLTGIGGDPTANEYVGASDNPTSTLEVNSWAGTAVAGGSSGLRFTNLNTTSPTTPNTGLGVLSVDLDGDVIYVPAASNGPGIGNYCGISPANALTADFDLAMGDNNYHFTDAGSPNPVNNVGIGTNCGALNARLRIVNPVMDFGVDATTSKVAFVNTGVRGEASDAVQRSVGVWGEAQDDTPIFNMGVYGHASNAVQTNRGGEFVADGPSTDNVGVEANASDGTTANFGVRVNVSGTSPQVAGVHVTTNNFFSASSAPNYGFFSNVNSTSATITNYGIFARVSGPGTNYAGYFDGDVYVNGGASSGTGYLVASDQIFKTNIDSIPNALLIMDQLIPRKFYYDTLNSSNIKFSEKLQYGFIAQEIEAVLPELVGSTTKPAEFDSTGSVINPSVTYKNLNYNAFIALLMCGIQEQQSTIDSLKEDNEKQDSINNSLQTQLNFLSDMINACCSNHSMLQNNSNTGKTDVNLKDGQSIVLEQNVPNPFAEQTTIGYFLPDNSIIAQMLFYNAGGKLIQSVDLKEKGKGQLNVFGSDLTNGIYTYTLVVDGKIVETKKMMKQ